MKTTIDTRPPREMPMSQRREIERVRSLEIIYSFINIFLYPQRQKQALVELDNRLLLDRLAVAMSVKNIDNERKHVTFISLMEGKKKRELKRIEDDNRRLLQAIRQTVPVYNHVQWEKEAENRVHYLRNMTEFPDLFVPPGQGKKASQTLSPTPSPLDRFKKNDQNNLQGRKSFPTDTPPQTASHLRISPPAPNPHPYYGRSFHSTHWTSFYFILSYY